MILNELIGRGLSVDTGVVVKDVKENMKKGSLKLILLLTSLIQRFIFNQL